MATQNITKQSKSNTIVTGELGGVGEGVGEEGEGEGEGVNLT